jgi:serine/threonine-protein kinase
VALSQATGPREASYRLLGRYALFGEIAAGGIATVHLARQRGAGGFASTVAVKRLRREHAQNPAFRAMFLDEARIAARVRHPNVVPILDVVAEGVEVFLVLEYVHGASLRRLMQASRERAEPFDLRIASAIACGVLHGLHAAHEARDEHGRPLGIIHRDVSPENILVGVGGMPRITDFGIARAAGRLSSTTSGVLKGKLMYMAPEQVETGGGPGADRRADVFTTGLVLWEMLAGMSLFGEHVDVISTFSKLEPLPAPSSVGAKLPEGLEAALMRALALETEARFATAKELAQAVEAATPGGLASPHVVAEWVERLVGAKLRAREEYLQRVEQSLPADQAVARTLVRASSGSAVDDLEASTLKRDPAPGDDAPLVVTTGEIEIDALSQPAPEAAPADEATASESTEQAPTAEHSRAGLPSHPDASDPRDAEAARGAEEGGRAVPAAQPPPSWDLAASPGSAELEPRGARIGARPSWVTLALGAIAVGAALGIALRLRTPPRAESPAHGTAAAPVPAETAPAAPTATSASEASTAPPSETAAPGVAPSAAPAALPSSAASAADTPAPSATETTPRLPSRARDAPPSRRASPAPPASAPRKGSVEVVKDYGF